MNAVASGTFAKFRTLVTTDAQLFNELRHAPDGETFASIAVKLGSERGFVFTTDDVRASLKAARRAWIERNLR